MYRIDEIKKLLRRHDYAPIVQKMGDGVLVRVPHPRLVDGVGTPLVQAYAIKRGVDAGLYYNSAYSPEEKFVSIPEYAIRLFVMSDVSARCEQVPISDHLVCYLDEEGREHRELESIVAQPSNQEDRSKEGFLTRLFTEARADNFAAKYEEVARTHGVREGYRLIKSFFEV